MKPFSILLTIVLAFVALSLVVFIAGPKKKEVVEQKPAPTVEDLPMPKSGRFGKAEVTEYEFNFGARNVGDRDKHLFSIKNVGEGILEFKLGKPTCQCTGVEITNQSGEVVQKDPLEKGVVQASRVPLPPGESVNVLVNWKMETPNEKFRQIVPVFTTDPDQRKIEFAIAGSIDTLLHIMPGSLWNLGEMSATEPSKAKGHIVSNVLDEFTVTEVPRENTQVKVMIEPADASHISAHQVKSAYSISVEVGPNIPVGSFRELIKLNIVSPQGENSAEFYVVGKRSGPIEFRGIPIGVAFDPSTYRLKFNDFHAIDGKKVTLTLIVKHFDEELVLQSVESAGNQIKVELSPGKPLGKTRTYQFDVEIPPGPVVKHRANDAEILHLKLNHPDVPDLELLIDYNATR